MEEGGQEVHTEGHKFISLVLLRVTSLNKGLYLCPQTNLFL